MLSSQVIQTTIDDLKNIIDLLDFDNISINVFLPKENQKEQ